MSEDTGESLSLKINAFLEKNEGLCLNMSMQ